MNTNTRYVIRHTDGTYWSRTNVGHGIARRMEVVHRESPEGVSHWQTAEQAEHFLRNSGRFDGPNPSSDYEVVSIEVVA